MNQEQYDRLAHMLRDVGTLPRHDDAMALLEAFEELHQALDEASEDHDPALDPPERDLCAVLFDADGNYKLRVRKP